MSRIPQIDPQTATGRTEELLRSVEQSLGAVPNFIRVLANSPAALNGFLGLFSVAHEGTLDPLTRERIALAVAEQNACQYCVSAHTALGRKAGLDNAEMLANRKGTSSDEKAAAALAFTQALVENTGDVTRAELDAVPNFIRVLANSPAALNGFLGLFSVAHEGTLDPLTRERIALAVAEQNACQYCVSAHTALGRKAGLDNAEMLANRKGTSSDEKAAAALAFTQALVENTGDVTRAELDAVRAAGHDDEEVVEIITHVALNLFTNLIGKAAQVDIDFPKIELRHAA